MLYSDGTTDVIAHFIGIFELKIEEARQRAEYDAFSALKARAEEHPDLPLINIKVSADYGLDDFAGTLRHTPATPANESLPPYKASHDGPHPPAMQSGDGGFPFTTGITPTGASPVAMGPKLIQPYLEPPASVAVVINQANFLSDVDIYGFADFDQPLVALQHLAEQLDGMVETATALNVFSDLAMPNGENGFTDFVHEIAEIAADADENVMEGADVTVLHGVESTGSHVNGEVVEELPDWKDHLPAALAPPPEGAEEEDGPTHDIDIGMNTLINQVALTASWLYAPVMAVAGNSISLNVINQINVWNDTDFVAGSVAPAGPGGGATTTASNVADIGLSATTDPATDGVAVGGTLPSNWAITRIEGNIVNTNWVQQYNFVADGDVTALSLAGTETELVFGSNTGVNSVSLYEIGYAYDLIVIGGDLIDVSMISQTNVMMDADMIHLDGYTGALTSGDNMLWNEARIHEVGVESYHSMTPDYASALEGFREGSSKVPDSILKDGQFEDVPILRVLYIDGSLMNLQLIEQMNVLGDADQVAMAAKAVLRTTGSDVEITVGSNAMINLASIAEFGIDSDIQIGGELYSDALLYQAELITTDNPLMVGSGPSALASEAVAFLADEMMTNDAAPAAETVEHHGPGDTGSLDVMQTMLA